MEITSVTTGSSTSGPLESLNYTGPKLSPMSYPSDLATDPSKAHYVKFLVKKITPKSPIKNFQANGFWPTASTMGKEAWNSFFTTNFSPPTSSIQDVISLYMPDTLNASFNASYDQLNLTNDLGKGAMLLQGINSVANYMGDKNAGAARSVDAIAAAAVGLGLSAAANRFGIGGAGITDVYIQSQGFAVNPQLQMIYRGLDFRNFQLSFTFTPASKKEADETNRIISTFKYHFSPDLVKPSNSQTGMFFIPPSLFNVEFMFGPEENQYLPRYGDCVLKDIDVNYAPNGFATHNDGSPIQTQLTLTFQEIEIVTKEKLSIGYNATSQNVTGSGNGQTAGLR